jgi:hypothetical protein
MFGQDVLKTISGKEYKGKYLKAEGGKIFFIPEGASSPTQVPIVSINEIITETGGKIFIEYDPETGEVAIKQLEYAPETGEVVIKQLEYAPETGELVKDQSYPDSLVSPSHPKVNLDSINWLDLLRYSEEEIKWIKHLTKEQKKKYNQNKIRIKGSEKNWNAYSQKGVFSSKRLYKSDFFIITGYPEKAEIAKHNQELRIKNSVLGTLIYYLGLGIATGIENPIGMVIGFGGAGYFYYDYNVKKLDGASLNDAKIIAGKYNNDLIQRIFNEND